MDDLKLESLAVKEIIEEIEKQKRLELESRKPPERKIRPNKRFLGRTIRSVLQHNRRQYAQERHNSSRKLKELERRRHRSKSTSRSRSKERNRHEERFSEHYQYEVQQSEAIPNSMPIDLTMYLMNLKRVNHLLNSVRVQKVSKKHKKQKKECNMLTIDLTKKKKGVKEKHRKKKHKSRQKKIKYKKRRRRKYSSSSNSSSTSKSSDSISAISESASSSSEDGCQSSTLLIDLT